MCPQCALIAIDCHRSAYQVLMTFLGFIYLCFLHIQSATQTAIAIGVGVGGGVLSLLVVVVVVVIIIMATKPCRNQGAGTVVLPFLVQSLSLLSFRKAVSKPYKVCSKQRMLMASGCCDVAVTYHTCPHTLPHMHNGTHIEWTLTCKSD